MCEPIRFIVRRAIGSHMVAYSVPLNEMESPIVAGISDRPRS
jgi:hypothetical protein